MEFKIGDQVRISSLTGQTGEPGIGLWGIIRTQSGGLWGVEFPGCDTFHRLNGFLKSDNGWFCMSSRLVLEYEPTEAPPTFWVFHDECWHECTNGQRCEGCGHCDCRSSTFHDHGIGECAGLHYEVWIEWFSKEIRCTECYNEHD